MLICLTKWAHAGARLSFALTALFQRAEARQTERWRWTAQLRARCRSTTSQRRYLGAWSLSLSLLLGEEVWRNK